MELRGARDESPLLMFTGKGLNEQDLRYALKGMAEACRVFFETLIERAFYHRTALRLYGVI